MRGAGKENRGCRETYLRGAGLFLRGKSVLTDVASDGVVDLNKMFFRRNCLQSLIIQTVVHLRRAASKTRSRYPEGFFVSLSNVGKG
jgi:hypothetical protein